MELNGFLLLVTWLLRSNNVIFEISILNYSIRKQVYMKVRDRHIFLLFLLFSFAAIKLSAQVTNQEEDFVKHREVERVAQLIHYISFMSDKSKSLEIRMYYCNKALDLFVANGSHYEENGVVKEGAMVEVRTSARGTTKRYLIRDYLKRIANGTIHPLIEIKSAEIILVNTNKDHLQLIDSNKGLISCESNSQMMVRFNEGRKVIDTLPAKKIKFTVNKSNECCDDEILYISKIGDISLVEERTIR